VGRGRVGADAGSSVARLGKRDPLAEYPSKHLPPRFSANVFGVGIVGGNRRHLAFL
jgi:hypothetical protein